MSEDNFRRYLYKYARSTAPLPRLASPFRHHIAAESIYRHRIAAKSSRRDDDVWRTSRRRRRRRREVRRGVTGASLACQRHNEPPCPPGRALSGPACPPRGRKLASKRHRATARANIKDVRPAWPRRRRRATDGRTDGPTDGSVIYRRRRLIPYPGGRRRRRRRDVMFYSSTRQNPRDDRHSDPPARVQLCHSRTIIRRLTMIYRYFMCRAALNSSTRRPGRSSTVY